MTKRTLTVALLGCGVVGSEVARTLLQLQRREELEARIGASLEIIGIAVRDVAENVGPGIDRALLTEDTQSLAERADIVVELIGGIEPAKSLILTALSRGACVVTANKALLAQDGPELYAIADASGATLFYEAAVAGAIPLIRPIRESLAGDRIERVIGIVNGTTNFVLDEMTKTGASLDAVVAQAQRLGYAEADPTADVEGFDAASKAAILASLAFHTRVTLDDVDREGILGVSADDVASATAMGYVIKLLAVAERVAGDNGVDTGVAVRVHPALVALDHPLASVSGAFNAVFVESESAGELMFYGQGAGGKPTSSAVVGDIVAAGRTLVLGGAGPNESTHENLPVLGVETTTMRYQLRLEVDDRPGVLASVMNVIAQHGVSIEAVRQTTRASENAAGSVESARLIILTHAATHAALAGTVEELRALDVVKSVMSVLRVLGT